MKGLPFAFLKISVFGVYLVTYTHLTVQHTTAKYARAWNVC